MEENTKGNEFKKSSFKFEEENLEKYGDKLEEKNSFSEKEEKKTPAKKTIISLFVGEKMVVVDEAGNGYLINIPNGKKLKKGDTYYL